MSSPHMTEITVNDDILIGPVQVLGEAPETYMIKLRTDDGEVAHYDNCPAQIHEGQTYINISKAEHVWRSKAKHL